MREVTMMIRYCMVFLCGIQLVVKFSGREQCILRNHSHERNCAGRKL